MKKKRDNYANKINRNKKINKFIIVGVVVAIALIVGVAVATIKMPANAIVPIDGIQCNNMEQSVFHIHAHLNIIYKWTKLYSSSPDWYNWYLFVLAAYS